MRTPEERQAQIANAKQLRELRQALGLGRTEAAHRLGVTRDQIRVWECGLGDIPIEIIEKTLALEPASKRIRRKGPAKPQQPPKRQRKPLDVLGVTSTQIGIAVFGAMYTETSPEQWDAMQRVFAVMSGRGPLPAAWLEAIERAGLFVDLAAFVAELDSRRAQEKTRRALSPKPKRTLKPRKRAPKRTWAAVDVRRLIAASGRSRKDIAASLGVGRLTVSRWVETNRIPTKHLAVLEALAGARPPENDVGEFLHDITRVTGLSLAKIANVLGIVQSAITQWKHHNRIPDRHLAALLALRQGKP